MADSIKLSATSDFTTAGKQFIGQVTGPHPKWGIALEFVGAKSGKRGDYTSVTVVDPGLYKLRDTTRKGVDDTYVLIWDRGGNDLCKTILEEKDALRLAKDLTPAVIEAAGRRVEIADTEYALRKSEAENQAEVITIKGDFADDLKIEPGQHPRHVVVAARQRYLERLRAPNGVDRLALESERATLVARLAEIDAQLERVS